MEIYEDYGLKIKSYDDVDNIKNSLLITKKLFETTNYEQIILCMINIIKNKKNKKIKMNSLLHDPLQNIIHRIINEYDLDLYKYKKVKYIICDSITIPISLVTDILKNHKHKNNIKITNYKTKIYYSTIKIYKNSITNNSSLSNNITNLICNYINFNILKIENNIFV
jgi:hypothetical protein